MVNPLPKKTFDYRLHQFALVAVVVGVIVSLIAAAIAWITQGVVATAMLRGTAFAVVAAYPVWRVYRRMASADRMVGGYAQTVDPREGSRKRT